MPVPIMFDTTSAVALTTPSCRRSAGLEEATIVFYFSATGENDRQACLPGAVRKAFYKQIKLLERAVTLLILLAAAAGARIVAADLHGRGGGLFFFFGLIFFLGVEDRSQALQPETLIEGKHDQPALSSIQLG